LHGAPILRAEVRSVRFAMIRGAVAALYRDHPDVVAYTAQGVRYTATTLTKVMATCARSGVRDVAAGLGAPKALGCGPLIYFFYSYGTQHDVPSAVNVAQRIYWFAYSHEAAIPGANTALRHLLIGWGLR
jgi:hypothetical protein